MARSPTPMGRTGRTVSKLVAGRASTIGLQHEALQRRRQDVRRYRRDQRAFAAREEAEEAERLAQTHSDWSDSDLGGTWRKHKDLHHPHRQRVSPERKAERRKAVGDLYGEASDSDSGNDDFNTTANSKIRVYHYQL